MALLHCCCTNTPITLSSSTDGNFSCLFKSSLNPIKFNENTLISLLFIFPETGLVRDQNYRHSAVWRALLWKGLWLPGGSTLRGVSSPRTRPPASRAPSQPAACLSNQSHPCTGLHSNSLFFHLLRERNAGRDVEKLFSFAFKN